LFFSLGLSVKQRKNLLLLSSISFSNRTEINRGKTKLPSLVFLPFLFGVTIAKAVEILCASSVLQQHFFSFDSVKQRSSHFSL
jgi:hypothetical protein